MAGDEVACSIRVVEAGGRPVAGALVSVLGADRPVPELAYETGADGTLTLRLPPGRVRLAVDREADHAEANVTLAAGEAGGVVEVRLGPAGSEQG